MWLFVVQQFLAASVAVVITILDNFPYGFLLFPMAKELQAARRPARVLKQQISAWAMWAWILASFNQRPSGGDHLGGDSCPPTTLEVVPS